MAAGGGRQAHPQRSFSSSPTALLQLTAVRRSLSARCIVKVWMFACVHMRAHVGVMLSASPASPPALFSCAFVLIFAVTGIDRLPPTLRLLRCRSLDAVAHRLAFCLAPFRLCLLHTQTCAPCTCTAELVGRPKAALAAPPPFPLPWREVRAASPLPGVLLVQLRCLALVGLRLC